MSMSAAKRRAKIERENPIKSPFKKWAAWFAGCIDFHHPGSIRCPLHPTLADEYFAGRAIAQRGYVKVPDLAEGLQMLRHVEAGNPPHTFDDAQKGLPL